MVIEEVVNFVGEAGGRRATVFFEKDYIQPYRVEYYSNDEHIGFIYFLTRVRAEDSARIFAFGENLNGNSNV